MMSQFQRRQKASDELLSPAPLPDGEELCRRKEWGPRGSPCVHKVLAKPVVRDGEVHVKIRKPEDGGRYPGAFANGAVLTYHEWAQSGYTPERLMNHCQFCGEVCGDDHVDEDEGNCVFCRPVKV